MKDTNPTLRIPNMRSAQNIKMDGGSAEPVPLTPEFPHDKGFSTRNLWYMKQWYEFYTREPQFLQRVVAEIQIPELRLQQAVAEIPAAFACIPWGQHIEIFTQCEFVVC